MKPHSILDQFIPYRKRNYLTVLSMVIVALLLFLIDAGPSALAQEKPLQKVVLAENWVLSGEHVGDFSALANGFYKDEGLDVTIERGFGAIDTLKRVATGSADFGRSTSVALVMGRAAGTPAKIIEVVMQTSPYGFAYITGKGINSPKDLAGKKIGIPSGSSTLQFWPAYAQKIGVDPSKSEIVNMDAAALVPSLAAGAVDAADSWLSSLPAFESAAESRRLKAGFMLWSDSGLTATYGSSHTASDKMIKDRPDVIRKFVRGTLRGHAWAIENPQKAIDNFMKLNPDRQRKMIEDQWRYTVQLSTDEYFEKNGLGYIEPAKMKEAVELIDKFVGLKAPVKPEDTYTNEFFKDLPKEWRFPKKVKF